MSDVSAEVQSVAVQGDVTLTLSVQGAEEGASASFEIKKVADDSVVTTVQGEVKEGAATVQWDPNITPDGDERGLRVYYLVTVDDQTLRSQELEVYLDWVEITSIDEQGAALPDVPYKLRVGDDVREGTTGSSGTCRESGLAPGEVFFDWRGPYQLVEWVDDKGPTRKAKLKRVQRLAFASPSPENNGGRRAWQEDGTEVELDARFHAWTQWTNLPYDARTELGRASGSKLTCTVRAVEPENAKQGEKVYVKVEWPPADQLSPRDDPEAPRQLVDGADKPWAQGDTQKGLELEFPADGGEVTFDVLLGKAGGDQVTIHVGGSDRCEDAKLVVTNRRKVYYETTRMEHQTPPDLTTVREWFVPAAVDLEAQVPEVVWNDQPPADGPADARGLAAVPASWLEQGADGQRVIVGCHNYGWFLSKFKDAAARTRTVQLVLADAIAFGAQPGTGINFEQLFRVQWTPEKDEATGSVILSKFIPLPSAENFEVFPQSLADGAPVLRGAKWKVGTDRTIPRDLRETRGEIDPSWVKVDRHRTETVTVGEETVTLDGRYGVWLELPPDCDPARALAQGAEVLFVGLMVAAQVGYSGMSTGPQIVVLTGGRAETDAVILGHELGHSMRLSPSIDPRRGELESRLFHLPPGLEFEDHASAYQGKGHYGGHCWKGLDEAGADSVAVWDDAAGQLRYDPLSGAAHEQEDYTALRKGEAHDEVGGTCIMYGSVAGAETRTGLCEDCTKFLRAGALEDLHKGTLAAIAAGEVPAPVEPEEPPPKLRLQLLDAAHKPCASTSYELQLPSGRQLSGSTDQDGWLEQDLQEGDLADATVTIKYTPPSEDEALELPLHFTAKMDTDCESDEVFLAHLRNLGFGRPDEPADEVVARFQGAVGLPVTGALDDACKDQIDAMVRAEGSLESALHPSGWEG